MAVRNIRDISKTKHVSYWEASHIFLIDLIDDGQDKAIRLSGKVLHGPGGRQDIKDVELYDGFEYSDKNVEDLESAFPLLESPVDPLQNG